MKFLNLFISLLKILRVLLFAGCIILSIAFIMELFLDDANINWNSSSIFKAMTPVFSKTFWIWSTFFGGMLVLVCLIHSSTFLIRVMLRFKENLFFEINNSADLKKASLYFLSGTLIIPVLFEIIHFIEYMIESILPNKLQTYTFDGIIEYVGFGIIGLFIYVMGEVIEKAISIRNENDLTI